MKISPRFYNPKFWRIVKCIFFLALFVYLLIESLSKIPEGKSYLMPIIWVMGIIAELTFLVDGLRMKPVAITEEFIIMKNAQILKNVKRGFFGGLAIVVIVSLILFLAGKPMPWKELVSFAVAVIVALFLLPIFISLGSDLPPKDEEAEVEQ